MPSNSPLDPAGQRQLLSDLYKKFRPDVIRQTGVQVGKTLQTLGFSDRSGDALKQITQIANALPGPAGAVAQALTKVFEVANDYMDNQKQSAAASKSVSNAIFNSSMDPRTARAIKNQVQARTDDAESVFGQVEDFFGFDGDKNEDIAKHTNRIIGQKMRARSLAGDLIDTNQIGQLQQDQHISLEEATDEALKKTIDPEQYRVEATKQASREFENDPLRQAMQDHLGGGMQAALEKRTQELMEDMVDAKLQSVEDRRQSDKLYAEAVQRNMTSTQRLKEADVAERAQAQFYSQRSRHKAWAND